MKQANRDGRIHALVGSMASLYDFLNDADPLEKIRSYENTVVRLVRQTAECAYFVAEYSKTESFGKHLYLVHRDSHDLIPHHIVAQRAVINMVSSADELIAAYETSFRELRIEFIMGSTLQTALTTVRILEKVDNIGMCVTFFEDNPLINKKR
jgi:hypothetical protein